MKYSVAEADLTRQGRGQLKQLRKARSAARKDARSGNPAKRYPALRAIAVATAAVGAVYPREAARRAR